MNKHSFIRFYYLFEDFDSEYPLGKVWGVKEEGERVAIWADRKCVTFYWQCRLLTGQRWRGNRASLVNAWQHNNKRERGGGRCAKTTMTSSGKRTRMRTLVCRANSLLQSRRRRRCCWQFVKQSTKPEIAQAEGGVAAGVRQRIAPRWQRFALEPCERLLPNHWNK